MASTLLSSVLNFLSFTWLLQKLDSDYIGDLVYYQSIAFGFLIVWNLGLNSLIVQQRQKDVMALFNTLYNRRFLFLSSAFILCGSFFYSLELFFAILYSISLVLVSFASTFLYSKGYNWYYFIYTNIGSVVSLALLFLVFNSSYPLILRIATLILSNLFQIIFFACIVRFKISYLNSDEAYNTRDSMNAFFAEVLSYGVEKTDKLFLRGTVTSVDYGLYSSIYQLGNVFGLASSAVARSFIGSVREVDESWTKQKLLYLKYLVISVLIFFPLSALYISVLVGISSEILVVLALIVVAFLFDSMWKLESTELALRGDIKNQSSISIIMGFFAIMVYIVASKFASIVYMSLSNLLVYLFGYVLSRRFAKRLG